MGALAGPVEHCRGAQGPGDNPPNIGSGQVTGGRGSSPGGGWDGGGGGWGPGGSLAPGPGAE